jgi:predicted AlkP superfamily pyrophosphatase or phosphodiesterase
MLKQRLIFPGVTAALLGLLLLPLGAFAQQNNKAAGQNPIVVMISIDGFPARALKDPRLPMPVLRSLEAQGAHAEAMTPINPTVTWPNHTTLITGVNASGHQVLENGLLTFPADGSAPVVKPWTPKDELVHARTLYEAAADKGLVTGQVDWVAIYGAKNVRWEFAEEPRLDGPIVRELFAQGAIRREDAGFAASSSPTWRDEIWTDAAIDILTLHTPDLLLFHLLQTDTLQHQYGPLTPAAYAAYANADHCIGRLVEAARQAGLLARITFIIVSDHGFASYSHMIHPNVALAERGLIAQRDGSWKGEAWFVPEGGSALLYIRDTARREEIVAKLKAYFATVPGVAGAYTNEEAQKLGIPARAASDQAPDLFLAAKPDYAFGNGMTGEIVTDLQTPRGAHGYLNSDSDMDALFIASGAHIRSGVDLGVITNLRVAPTVAKILGVSLPAATELPLAEALQ